jgi:hypothetical protein
MCIAIPQDFRLKIARFANATGLPPERILEFHVLRDYMEKNYDKAVKLVELVFAELGEVGYSAGASNAWEQFVNDQETALLNAQVCACTIGITPRELWTAAKNYSSGVLCLTQPDVILRALRLLGFVHADDELVDEPTALALRERRTGQTQPSLAQVLRLGSPLSSILFSPGSDAPRNVAALLSQGHLWGNVIGVLKDTVIDPTADETPLEQLQLALGRLDRDIVTRSPPKGLQFFCDVCRKQVSRKNQKRHEGTPAHMKKAALSKMKAP